MADRVVVLHLLGCPPCPPKQRNGRKNAAEALGMLANQDAIRDADGIPALVALLKNEGLFTNAFEILKSLAEEADIKRFIVIELEKYIKHNDLSEVLKAQEALTHFKL